MEGLCDRERELGTEGGEEGWLTTGRLTVEKKVEL